MKFGYTIIYVGNVESTLEFYNRAFGLKTSFLHDSGMYGELSTGGTALAFVNFSLVEEVAGPAPREGDKSQRPAFKIALVTEDVQKAFDHAVKAGAEAVSKPQEKPWGQTVAYVRSIEGTIVELCTPMAQ